jgi:hypothetical protein
MPLRAFRITSLDSAFSNIFFFATYSLFNAISSFLPLASFYAERSFFGEVFTQVPNRTGWWISLRRRIARAQTERTGQIKSFTFYLAVLYERAFFLVISKFRPSGLFD